MLVTKQLMLHNIYLYLFAYHGSQWGPSTVWLPTFLNISYFVLNRIKKLVLSCKLWTILKILHKIISACKFCPVFLYAVLLNNTFDMICVRSVLFSAMGKYLENLSIKKLLWRHAEGFVGLKRHINSCSYKLKCSSQQISAPNIVNRPLNPASSQSRSFLSAMTSPQNPINKWRIKVTAILFFFNCPLPLSVLVWDKLPSHKDCMSLSVFQKPLFMPSLRHSGVCLWDGRLGGLELLYLCCFFSTTIAAGWGTETNFLSFPFLPCFLPSFLTSSFLSFLFLF